MRSDGGQTLEKKSDRITGDVADYLRRQLRDRLKHVQKPRIKSVGWVRDRLCVTIALPFLLPLPTGEGEWLGSKEDQETFRGQLRERIRTSRALESAMGLLASECHDFMVADCGIHRFDDDIVQNIGTLKRKRKSGRPSLNIAPLVVAELKSQHKAITDELLKIKNLIRIWRRKGPKTPEALETKIRKHLWYRRLSWDQFMFACFKELPTKHRENERYYVKKLSEPRSWSASQWAQLIVQRIYRRETGSELPASAFTKTNQPSKSRHRRILPSVSSSVQRNRANSRILGIHSLPQN